MDSFTYEIYRWYIANKRDLPWRQTKDPYKIWISEIILQQTRVAQGTNYYNRFIEEFPSVFELANASEDAVLKIWQGLGYYTRARNIHLTAKILIKNYNGVFPDNFETILSLKGIGNYTASAIASIAFNLPHAAVDGNIYRVLSRYFGISTPIDSVKGKIEIQKIATGLIPSENTGFHNQALMEFGAMQCIPKSPECKVCPLISSCFAGNNNLTDRFPVKSKKIKQTYRYFYYYLIESKNSILFEKRTVNDIWRNLNQFPLVESEKELTDLEILNLEIPFQTDKKVSVKSISATNKHILTHQTIYSRVIHIETDFNGFNHPNFIKVNKKEIYKFAVPKLIEKYLKKLNYVSQ
jgi:A/G-specific adenine glycosylase